LAKTDKSMSDEIKSFVETVPGLKETKGLLLRQVEAVLEMDTAFLSKMESNSKPVSKASLTKLARLYCVEEKQLLTLWLADKVYAVVKDQDLALKAIEVAEEEIKNRSKNKN